MKFNVRAFVSNPNGTYNPAPLHEFDTFEGDAGDFIPQVGDVLRWDATLPAYTVVNRFFDYSNNQCSLLVEPFFSAFISP